MEFREAVQKLIQERQRLSAEIGRIQHRINALSGEINDHLARTQGQQRQLQQQQQPQSLMRSDDARTTTCSRCNAALSDAGSLVFTCPTCSHALCDNCLAAILRTSPGEKAE